MEQLAQKLATSGVIDMEFIKEVAKKTLEDINSFVTEKPSYKKEFEQSVEILNSIDADNDQIPTADELLEFKTLIDTINSALSQAKKKEEKKVKENLLKVDLITNDAILNDIEKKMMEVNANGEFVRMRQRNGKDVSIFRAYLTVHYIDGKSVVFEHYNKEKAKNYLEKNSHKIVKSELVDEWTEAAKAWKALRRIKSESDIISDEAYAIYENLTVVKGLERGYNIYKSKFNDNEQEEA